MKQQQISIRTLDGDCPGLIATPDGDGLWPAVTVCMDGLGRRPALVAMAARLADSGYVVLLPDLFYRFGSNAARDPKPAFAGDFPAIVGPLMATTDNHKAAADTEALLADLDTRRDVPGSKVGTVGFCMGGGTALIEAAAFPDRVAVAASSHGGNLATDASTSPHLLATRIKAEVYVAGADNDGSHPPDMAERLDVALGHAGVKHRCETCPGAAHGWMMPDFPIFDEGAAARGWQTMRSPFRRNL